MFDGATGLVRFGARDYDGRVGRWTAKDPASFEGGSNSFLFVDGNPTTLTDPTGYDAMYCRHGNNIKITIPVIFENNGLSPADFELFKRQFASDVASRWSGDFGRYNVDTSVQEVTSPDVGFPNFVNVSPGSQGKVNPLDAGAAADVIHNRVMNTAAKLGGVVQAHEAGHLLGIPDLDQSDVGTDLMTDPLSSGRASDFDIGIIDVEIDEGSSVLHESCDCSK